MNDRGDRKESRIMHMTKGNIQFSEISSHFCMDYNTAVLQTVK